MELVDGSKRVGTNQEPTQLIVRRIGDCAVVRSTTDGHDAHNAYCNFAYCNFAYCDIAYCDIAYGNSSKDNCDIAYSNFAYSNIAGFSGCFCVPRRLV